MVNDWLHAIGKHMKKYWYIISVIYLIPIVANGQNEYYLTDSIISVGKDMVDYYQNPDFVLIKEGDKFVKRSPDEIKEFGCKDGRVYLSKNIATTGSTHRIFLERLTKGELTLYYYKHKGGKSFFLEKDSTSFFELSKRSPQKQRFNKQLAELMSSCPNAANAAKLVSYSRNSMAKLISSYNGCVSSPFPYFRYGITVGYELVKQVPSQQMADLNLLNFKYEGGFIVGVFIDEPIRTSDFSFHPEAYFSQQRISRTGVYDNMDVDYISSLSGIKLPLLLRYTYPSNKIRPFANAGGVLSYNIQNINHLYESTIINNRVNIDELGPYPLVDKMQFGYSFGVGVEYKLSYRRSIFLELRYSSIEGLQHPKSMSDSEINLITEINF